MGLGNSSPVAERRVGVSGSPSLEKSPAAARRWQRLGDHRSTMGAAALLLIVLVALLIAAPRFYSGSNLTDLVSLATPVFIGAVGALLVVITGNFDVSIGAMAPLCSVIAAELATRGVPAIPTIMLTMLFGAALGSFNGLLVATFKLPSIVVTLASGSIFAGVLVYATHGNWLIGLPSWFTTVGDGRSISVPNPVFVAIAVALAGAAFLRFTGLGRRIFAVGSSPSAADLAGISVRRTLIWAFALNGMLVGLVGVVIAGQTGIVQSTENTSLLVSVITAVLVGGADVFGGAGTVPGIVLGALLVQLSGTALAFVGGNAVWQEAVEGLFIVVAVLLSTLRRSGGSASLGALRLAAGRGRLAGGQPEDAHATVKVPKLLTALRDAAINALRGGGWRRAVKGEGALMTWGLAVALAGVTFVMAVMSPNFLKGGNLLQAGSQNVPLGIVALGMTAVLLVRGLDLSVGSTIALISVAIGWMGQHGIASGAPAAGIGLVIAICCGAFNGLLIAYARIPAFVVTIGTLAGYAGLAAGIAGSNDYIVNGFLANLAGATVVGVPVPLIILAVVALTLLVVLRYTTLGRRLRAIGVNPIAARYSGVDVRRYTFWTYVMSGLLAGVAALMYVGIVNSARSDFGTGYELQAIAIAVLGGTLFTGGRASALGTVMAFAIFTFLANGLEGAGYPTQLQEILTGAIVIGALIFYQSLPSLSRRIARRRRNDGRPTAPAPAGTETITGAEG